MNVAEIQNEIEEHVKKRGMKRLASIKKASERNRHDFIMPVHYNDNGKLFCAARGTNPTHTTEKSEVTCSYCLRKFTPEWKSYKK